MIEHEQRREVVVKRRQCRVERQGACRVDAPAAASMLELPSSAAPLLTTPPRVPIEPEAKPVHPWRRAWSVRRQRELASAA